MTIKQQLPFHDVLLIDFVGYEVPKRGTITWLVENCEIAIFYTIKGVFTFYILLQTEVSKTFITNISRQRRNHVIMIRYRQDLMGFLFRQISSLTKLNQ